MQLWQPAYIGIGSNLSDPSAQVAAAMGRLAALPDTRLVLCSPLYGSRSLQPGQPDFVNAVAGVLTRLAPRDLLRETQAAERAAGRPLVHEHWGPRVLDLDLLIYGRMQSADPQLHLPHPGVVERNFVLYPLAAIAPDLEVPGRGLVRELAARVQSCGIWLLPHFHQV
jgi:2-amino-4-hydroxy-6-hydroxymethyldihydropteridine diphosphokinase